MVQFRSTSRFYGMALGASILFMAGAAMAAEPSDYPTYGPAQDVVVNGVRVPQPQGNEDKRHVGRPFALWAYLQSVAEPQIGSGATGPSYVDDAPEGAPVPLPKPRKRIVDGASGV